MRWARGVRGRSAVAAVVVVAVGLVLAAAIFLLILQRDLTRTVQQNGHARAREVISLIRSGGVGALVEDSSTVTRGSQIVQVVDAGGQVVTSSSARGKTSPLTDVPAAPGQFVEVQASRVPLLDDDDPYLLVVSAVRSDGATYRVIVASSISAEQEAVRTALFLFVVGVPLLLVLVGVATWLLVGRALGPVERIRRRVNEIRGARLDARIPVPASDDEIARLATTMNEMLTRLDDAQQAQRRFVADSGHELRSPLATLAASMELASTDATDRTWRDLSPVMAKEVTRMSRLVEDLLFLAKADEHTVRLREEEVDLDDLVADEVRRLRAQTDVAIETQIQPVRVVGDRARLGQVLTNLGDNATRHATSQVRIGLCRTPGGAQISIDDDGAGIPEADRGRVFERFVRLDDSRGRSSGGSGLGLAIVREIVSAHGGFIDIGHSEPSGCRVTVTLPLSELEAEPGGQPPSTARR